MKIALIAPGLDFIHLHFDLYALFCNTHLKKPYCVTTHCGGFSKFEPNEYEYYPAFNYLYQDCLNAPGNIVLSDEIKDTFLKSGYKKFLKTLRNPVEIEKYNFVEKGNGKAVYLGNINARKRQAFWAKKFNTIQVDFIGALIEDETPTFVETKNCTYLGVWEKQALYDNLTNYSCLVLLSKSEADALVVKEALAAGLSLVVNESCSANLTDNEFITILPDDVEDPQVVNEAIQKAIDNNNALRKDIRKYAYDRFSYDVLVPQYVDTIKEFIDFSKVE